jgi:predicted kinase
MSGLRPYPELQQALDAMDPPGHRGLGWSILGALARSELRRGRSVVLDGVARSEEIGLFRHLADQETARLVLIATECSDVDLHRQRVEGRQRLIPDWYELAWEHVARTRRGRETPQPADLVLDAAGAWEPNEARLYAALDAAIQSGVCSEDP